jgi:hypothetical protein
VVAAITVAALAASPVRAEVLISGTTDGCFGAGCSAVSGSTTTSHLTFTDNTFGGTTVSNQLSVSTFGVFSLENGSNNYNGTVFTLFLDFTAPAGTSPDPSTISAAITGTVSGNTGSLHINFADVPQVYTFNGGTFSLILNDIDVGVGSSSNVSGLFTVTAVPEPSTWAMIILGFLGVGFAAYRRKGAASAMRFA